MRKSFEMSDADLLAWFNRQIEDLGQSSDGARAEIATLELLRDALVKEVKRGVPVTVALPEK